ncbi:MAG: UDP-3-O-(3-hydroxymyristoyl)glucosamine N-acyltransferase [Chromatiales bacterium]|jgi:UDP-3-O-[3-hydroxymyristoyl] glucosamine N-acyltransferase|nr:UDP-3-O-(3-hydroxymyristoyl)glucosamine N-acyltransferase [Chromatiales bacterium]
MRLGELAERLGARLQGDARCVIERIDTLERATAGAVSFFANRRYRAQLRETSASAVIVAAGDVEDCPSNALVMDNPYVGYARAARLLNPLPDQPYGVHPSASVAPDAVVHATAWIGPNAVIESGAAVGAGCFIGPVCVLSEGVSVGEDCYLTARVTLMAGVRLGARVTIHPGAVLGADGFGIANDDGVWVKVPQLGIVRVGDDVDIGANTCIDRGALEDTIIADGVKIDNHVQIGHNVRIGAHTAVAGCVAIAGSAKIGERCTVGGSSAISGHLDIADDVHLTGGTNVPNSIPEAGVYSSALPLQTNRAWRKSMVRVKQLDDLARRLRALETKT